VAALPPSIHENDRPVPPGTPSRRRDDPAMWTLFAVLLVLGAVLALVMGFMVGLGSMDLDEAGMAVAERVVGLLLVLAAASGMAATVCAAQGARLRKQRGDDDRPVGAPALRLGVFALLLSAALPIFSFVGGLLGLVALATGITAWIDGRRRGAAGTARAVVGMVCGALAFAIGVWVYFVGW
jgi:hypothetical protein